MIRSWPAPDAAFPTASSGNEPPTSPVASRQPRIPWSRRRKTTLVLGICAASLGLLTGLSIGIAARNAGAALNGSLVKEARQDAERQASPESAGTR